MSRGDLQEMEVGTKQSKGPVNANAKAGDPMKGLSDPGKGLSTSWEDLGGPTPENYKPDNDSGKLKTPGGTIKQVSDVVTNRKPGQSASSDTATPKMKNPLKSGDEVELEADQEVVSETEEVAEEQIEETIDIEADVNALLGGEELSEEFREKAKTVFEAALNSKVKEVKEELQIKHDEKIAEEIEASKKELTERVDAYLEYVSQEWFVENELAIEHGIKTELTESFLSGMKGLFEEHYVEIPEEKYDVLKSMVEKLDDMETKLNEQIEKNIGLNRRLAESVADGILESVSDGLATTQKEKLTSLAESVEFESETQYREKLETLKESYFSSKPNSPSSKTESLSEGVDSSNGVGEMSNSMNAYLKSLGSTLK